MKSTRKIKDVSAVAASVDVAALTGDASDLPAWIEDRARKYNLQWLLAHADDGVIWGRAGNGTLVTSREAAEGDEEALGVCPPLRLVTLQQARLFGDKGELMLWKGGDRRFRARLIRKAGDTGDDPDWTEGFDEEQMLWGSTGRRLKHDFFFWREKAEGLRHALPFRRGRFLEAEQENPPPPRLCVRHYLNRRGAARVVASRLVTFEPNKQATAS